MGISEFALIERYFRHCGVQRSDVRLGVGDDAALLECPRDAELVATVDTLVEGNHFPAGSPAASLGHRALAVNLSDLAAMGARPAWALLSLTMPSAEEGWLGEFASGFSALARAHGVALVGGNTTSGPLCISVQLLGHVPRGAALVRSAGKPGDDLFVSGTPGDSTAGLALEQGRLSAAGHTAKYLRERFLFPTPRVALGERLRKFASACIDVSDGLLGDAGKLAQASRCGLEIEFGSLPVSAALVEAVGNEQARRLALTGGEDYELCFTVRAEVVARMQQELPPEQWGYRRIGVLSATPGARVLATDASVMDFSHSGFSHFGPSN
jgi:thiamine-monophosphate kinase